MTWNSLVEVVAQQSAELDRRAREGVLSVPSPETIAFFVRFQRGLLGWKQDTLAFFARVSLSTIERIERAEPVSAEKLDRVAIALRQEPGAFTTLRVPLGDEEAKRRLEESAAPFNDTVMVAVRPLQGHRQLARLARTHLAIIDAGRLDSAFEAEVAPLREWLDLTSFILATEAKNSVIRTGAKPVKRRELYDDALRCVNEIERRGNAVALAGTYQAETGHPALPKADIALIGFFPKLTDPAAIKRRTLYAPARVDLSAAWRHFCEQDD